MAHGNSRKPSLAESALALAFALIPLRAAEAAALGEIELRSFLGEQFDARIPVSASEGELLEESCFSLVQPEAGAPAVMRAKFTLEGDGNAVKLRVQSSRPWNEPVASLRVRYFCGRSGPVVRDYALLLDPRGNISFPAIDATPVTTTAQRTVPAPAAATPAPLAPPPGRLIASSGDTLASIAGVIYPKSRRLQKAFIAAMRSENSLGTLGDSDPLPEGMEIALPDLLGFANSAGAAEAARDSVPPASRGEPPAAAPARPTASKPVPAKEPKAPRVASAPRMPEAAPAQPAPSAPRSAGDGFRLRLSTGDIDLSRSRGMDDEKRNRLRERQLVLDSDDQVAALLSLRHHLKELETRVAAMQLQLTTSVPAAAVAPAAQKAPAPISPPLVEPPARPAATPVVEPPVKAATAPTEAARPPPAPPVADTPAAKPAPEAITAKPPGSPALKPVESPSREPMGEEGLPAWLWGVVALIVAAVAWLAWRLVSGRRRTPGEDEPQGTGPTSQPQDTQPPSGYADGLDEDPPSEPALPPERQPARVGEMTMQVAAYRPAPEMESDASLVTRVSAGDPGDLRRRYIEERFPELANRTISLGDTDSIVKGARLFYEDGAHSRAVELLTVAIEERPEELKLWLALFEIYRLDEMKAEFAELAERFRARHGESKYWPKVRHIGREIDPQNPLYSGGGDGVENIRDSVTRRPGTPEFDPLAENWLNAPMDFMTDALASDLRRAVLAEHGVTEADLAPNPMPALKNMEVFRVS